MDNRKKTNTNEEDEVEQLLRAAQDELLLKLSVDSHMSGVSPDYLDSDLDCRFQALRSRPSSKSKSKPNPQHRQPREEHSEDDLLVRFAALKASLPSSSSVGFPVGSDGTGEDNDDEVDKVIRWAIDAARLDPSLPSDEDDKHSTDDQDDDDTGDDGKLKKKKKGQRKKHSPDDEDDDDDTDDDGKLKKKKKGHRKLC